VAQLALHNFSLGEIRRHTDQIPCISKDHGPLDRLKPMHIAGHVSMLFFGYKLFFEISQSFNVFLGKPS